MPLQDLSAQPHIKTRCHDHLAEARDRDSFEPCQRRVEGRAVDRQGHEVEDKSQACHHEEIGSFRVVEECEHHPQACECCDCQYQPSAALEFDKHQDVAHLSACWMIPWP